jgi:hypothetical protein
MNQAREAFLRSVSSDTLDILLEYLLRDGVAVGNPEGQIPFGRARCKWRTIYKAVGME